MGGGVSTQNAKQYANLYAKEGFRTIKEGVKEGTRAARQGLELSKAVYRKFDVTGQKRKKVCRPNHMPLLVLLVTMATKNSSVSETTSTGHRGSEGGEEEEAARAEEK